MLTYSKVNALSITTRLSTKMNRRIFATIIGIAFCTTYLAGTIAMVGGLHETTSTLAAGFDQGPTLVYTDEDFTLSEISGAKLPGNDTTYVAFCFTNVTFWNYNYQSSDNVYAVSIYDPENILGLNMTNESQNSGVWMGTQLQEMLALDSITATANTNYILARDNRSVNIFINTLYSEGSIFPDDWLLIPRETMDILKPELAGNYSFLMIVDSEIPVSDQPFANENIETAQASGVVGYFEKGIYQVEQGLWGIIAMSGLITALLVYCIISIETEYSGPTIRILRGVGASREYVVQIFVLKAMFITLMGGVLGTALGFCAASAISSVSSLMDVMTFITPLANFNSVAVPVIISLVSGLVGGLWPAVRASRMFSPRRSPK